MRVRILTPIMPMLHHKANLALSPTPVISDADSQPSPVPWQYPLIPTEWLYLPVPTMSPNVPVTQSQLDFELRVQTAIQQRLASGQ